MLKRLFSLSFFILFLSSFTISAQSLAEQIEKLMQDLPEGSDVGISIYDLTDQRYIYNYREKKLCRPASTQKLLTGITALDLPQADLPFTTEVWTNGEIKEGTLNGDLYIIGDFDPEFDEQSMQALVDQIKSFPINNITGKVYGDVSIKDSLYWGSGWAWDDTPNAFQPHLSPLMYCKGVVTYSLTPSAAGNVATVSCFPRSSFYQIENNTKSHTPNAGSFELTRDWMNGDNTLLIKGNVPSKIQGKINLHHPESFFIHALVEKLLQNGIHCKGEYAFNDFNVTTTSTKIASWSTSMSKVLKEMMKESDNLNAEALLNRIARQSTGKTQGTTKDGLEAIKQLIKKIGLNPSDYRLADGCGLSNYNYITPELLVAFLRYAYSNTELFQKLYKSLPIAGIDGTLSYRMGKTKAFKNVHAKTGAISGIYTLAGYLKANNGHQIAFAIMNQNALAGKKPRSFQNEVCTILCE